jgi:uncharacterized protein (DUF305 family)
MLLLAGALAGVALLVAGLGAALAQTPAGAGGWGPGGMGGMGSMSGMMGSGMMGGPMHGGPGGGMLAGDAARWFIEEMIPHHEDAVAMADLALAQAEHPELKALAAEIKRVQTQEIDQMRAWHQQWYGTAPRPGVMQGHMRGVMGDPAALNGARPFDKAFIEQMIPHHQMAVMMAAMALPRVDRPELRQLLQSIIAGQSAEIDQMRAWYRAWYGALPPVTGPGRGHAMGGGMMGGCPDAGPAAGRT